MDKCENLKFIDTVEKWCPGADIWNLKNKNTGEISGKIQKQDMIKETRRTEVPEIWTWVPLAGYINKKRKAILRNLWWIIKFKSWNDHVERMGEHTWPKTTGITNL
jgi:GTPase SAR1 family protein